MDCHVRTQLKYVHCFEENRKMFPHNYPQVIPGKMNTKQDTPPMNENALNDQVESLCSLLGHFMTT